MSPLRHNSGRRRSGQSIGILCKSITTNTPLTTTRGEFSPTHERKWFYWISLKFDGIQVQSVWHDPSGWSLLLDCDPCDGIGKRSIVNTSTRSYNGVLPHVRPSIDRDLWTVESCVEYWLDLVKLFDYSSSEMVLFTRQYWQEEITWSPLNEMRWAVISQNAGLPTTTNHLPPNRALSAEDLTWLWSLQPGPREAGRIPLFLVQSMNLTNCANNANWQHLHFLHTPGYMWGFQQSFLFPISGLEQEWFLVHSPSPRLMIAWSEVSLAGDGKTRESY